LSASQKTVGPEAFMKNRKSKDTYQPAGRRFSGVRGKTVDHVVASHAEGIWLISVAFTDHTELCLKLSAALKIQEATLSDWKSGNEVIKHRYPR